MATTASAPDELPYKLHTEFRKGRVVVHQRSRARWWEVGVKGDKEEWSWAKDLGAGGFGLVWLEEEAATRQLRAVKRLTLLEMASKRMDFRRELQTLIALRNYQDLFVQFLGWYQDENFIYLAMEYVQYGDLEGYLEDCPKQAKINAEEITRQLLAGLVVLHEQEICHRDLKPQNVLVASPSPIHIKLADFGVSKCTKGAKLETRCGTVGYQAPELLGLLPWTLHPENEYTNSVDMWALGCLVYKLLTLELPFTESLPENICSETGLLAPDPAAHKSQLSIDLERFSAFCKAKIELPVDRLHISQASESGIDFIKQLLVADPKLRMSAARAVTHKWIFDSSAALQAAAERGNINRVRFLLQNGADVNAEPCRIDGRTALQAAAQGAHIDVVRLLLDNGAEVNARPATLYGRTALQAAAQAGNLDVVRLLVQKQADVNAMPCEFYGRTALQAAAHSGNFDVVKLVLDSGAEVDPEYEGGTDLTSFQPTTETGCLEELRMLLKKGIDVNPEPRTIAQHLKVVERRLEENAAMNAKSHEIGDRTPLQAAARRGHLKVVGLLLDNGADVNAEPYTLLASGRTALQAASEGAHLEVVQLLLEKNANVNAPPADFSGRTALQAAAQGGHLEVMRLLLAKHAEVNADPCPHNGRTALQAAADGGHLYAVKLLLEEGATDAVGISSVGGRTALQAAAGGGYLDVVRTLLSSNTLNDYVNVSPCHIYGQTALQAAAQNGNYDVVKLLMDAGADVNALPSPSHGRTALQAAAENGHLELATLLLDCGAGVNAEPADIISGRTALQAASGGGHSGMVYLLLERGADVNAVPCPTEGLTATEAAIQGKHPKVAHLLWAAGNGFTNLLRPILKFKDETQRRSL